MARTDSMSTIQAYLSPPEPTPAAEDTVPNVQIAPGINAPAPLTELTAGQARALSEQRNQRKEQGEATQALERSRKEQLEAAMAAEQERQDAFEKSAATTVGAVKRIGRGANVRLSNIPLPGGLTLPIVILLVFFALLIPVNGHTRLVWLWLTLTNNAFITGSGVAPVISDTAGASVTGTSPTSTGTQTGGSVLPVLGGGQLPILPLLQFAGVEEVS